MRVFKVTNANLNVMVGSIYGKGKFWVWNGGDA